MNSTIIELENGKYATRTYIQDGVENGGPFDTIKEAQDNCLKIEKIMNGIDINPDDIMVQEKRSILAVSALMDRKNKALIGRKISSSHQNEKRIKELEQRVDNLENHLSKLTDTWKANF